MKRLLAWSVGVFAASVLSWFFPLFHVVPLRQARQIQQQAGFDAVSFSRQFWQQKLLPATAKATNVAELAAALATDHSGARKHYGHSPGLGTTTYFFVNGTGHVTAIEKENICVTLDTQPTCSVNLFTGLLFGNAVRDSSGLLDSSAFGNSQDFNALSTELNHLVETEVVPALREKASIGKAIQFAGCIALGEEAPAKTLQMIPVKVDWP
jgi:predicted lipoprotein